MLKKLLNKNNLIIGIITLSLVILAIPNVVLADSYPLSDYLKETIAAWYVFIKYFCLAVMFVVFIALGIKAAFSGVAEDKAKFKEMLIFWIIGLILLLMLDRIIYAVIAIEQYIVEKLRTLGQDIVGESTVLQEKSLYESARTKAYEIKFSSGMLGLFMYIVLVYYTFKFFIIYIKRYLNVMILILVGPIVIVMYTFRRVFQGKGGLIGRWVKELLYNVFIQVVHAATYSILVGFSLRLSDNALSFLGAILTFVAFFFMSKLDGIIRKIFNFIGGKSTIQVRDYSSILKHPVDSFKDAKGYLTETLPQEMQGKAEQLAENFTPENVKKSTIRFANNFAHETKETMAALDAKRVKVSKEAIQKEQEKLDKPNLPQKILNTIQGLALGATQMAITGVETLAKKVKEQYQKLKEATKNARKELNQDFEMVKRFTRILKHHVVRKKIEKVAVEDEEVEEEVTEEKIEYKLEATVINVLKSEAEEALELKTEINENKDDNDMVATAYKIYGPAIFIYQNISSSYIGISVLASAKYEEMTLKTTEKTSETKGKVIMFPYSQLAKNRNKEEVEVNEGKKSASKKKYTFKRFNRASIITITRSLNRRLIMNSEYLSNIYQVGQMVANGDVQVKGSYIPKGYTRIKRTSIKYTAKMVSHNKHQAVANIELARYSSSKVKEMKLEEQKGQIIHFTSVRQRKQQAQVTVQNYHERVQDSNWAVLAGTATDVRQMHTQKVVSSVQAVRQQSSAAIALQQMADMGQALKINDDLYVTFSDKSVQSFVGVVQEEATAKLENVVSESGSMFAKSEKVVAKSEETTVQAVIDSSIIDVAMNLDVPLEQVDFKNDESVQESILTTLAQKGVVSYSEIKSETKKTEVITSLEERKEEIVKNDKDNYINSVMKKTAAKMFVNAVNTGDVVVDKVKDVGSKVYQAAINNEVINNDYTKLLGQIAKGAVQSEAERVKQELMDQVQKAVDTTKDYVNAGKELYGVSKDDFKKKGEQIKQGAKDFAIGVEETAEKAAKAALDAAIDPFRIESKKDKRKPQKKGKDKYDSDDVFIFYILGAVVNEGRYELPIGSKVYDAIKVAGGPTEDADLTAISYYDPIRNGETIYIPKRSNDDVEKILEKCRPVVEKTIKDYIVENNISNIESLKKLVHKKTILSKIQRALAEEKISANQIENLFEERIKELKFIRDGLNNAAKDMEVVDKAEVIVQETESIKQDRKRQEAGARNAEEASLDEALKKLHELSNPESSGESSESYEETSEETGQDALMNQLLMQLEEQKEKVLVSAENRDQKQQLKALELEDTEGEENSEKYAARRNFTRDPDEMMNRMLGRL